MRKVFPSHDVTGRWYPWHGWVITFESQKKKKIKKKKNKKKKNIRKSWWRHQMRIFSALLALCVGNPHVTGVFPSQRPMTRDFDFFLICAWTNGWENHRDAGDLRRDRAHYDVNVMPLSCVIDYLSTPWIVNLALRFYVHPCSNLLKGESNLTILAPKHMNGRNVYHTEFYISGITDCWLI